MPAISRQPFIPAQTVVVTVATAAAVALLGLVLAQWTWAWLAPAPESRAPAVAPAQRDIATARGLFGTAPLAGPVATPTGMSIRLLGVAAAAAGQRGYAAMQLDGKQIVAVHEGELVAPGIRLLEVAADRVILDRNGARETLAWPTQASAAQSTPPPTQ